MATLQNDSMILYVSPTLQATSELVHNVRSDLSSMTQIVDDPQTIQYPKEPVVMIIIQQESDGDVWKLLTNKTKKHNAFSEIIIICSKGSLNATEVLTGGCFAYFQPEFEVSVLRGYINAAIEIISNRIIRFTSSQALANSPATLDDLCDEIFENLKKLIDYDRASLSLLHERDYINDVDEDIEKLVRTLVRVDEKGVGTKAELETNMIYHRPIKEDDLIRQILNGEITERVFVDVANELPDLWHSDALDVYSWIVLPIIFDNKPIAILTLDFKYNNPVNYASVNKRGLLQFANEVALSINVTQQADSAARLEKALTSVAQQTNLHATLTTIAEQACELVDGLFSYVVLPDDIEENLIFHSAWSRHRGGDYLLDIKRRVEPFNLHDPTRNSGQKKSITVLAYETATPVLVDDCRNHFDGSLNDYIKEAQEALYRYEYEYFNEKGQPKSIITKSNLAVPIIDNINVYESPDGIHTPIAIGSINIEHEFLCKFSQEQLSTINKFAGFAAIAIRNQKAKERLNRLFDTSNNEIYLENDDIDEILNRLANETKKASNATAGVRIFAKMDNKTFMVGHSDDVSTDFSTETRGLGGHTWWCIENQRPIVINDVAQYNIQLEANPNQIEYQYNGEAIGINPATKDQRHQCLICIPMTIRNKVNGAIWLHFLKAQNITTEEIDELVVYAKGAALALNSNLRTEFLTISEIIASPDTPSSDTSEKIANRIVNYVKSRFGVEGVAFYAPDDNHKTLVRISTSKDSDTGRPKVKYGEGLVGHLFQAEDVDGYKYSDPHIHIHDYSKYKHALPITQQSFDLGSVLAIRLRVPLKKDQHIGVLLISDSVDRDYTESLPDLERFANLIASILTLRNLVPSSITTLQRIIKWTKLSLVGFALYIAPEFISVDDLAWYYKIILIVLLLIVLNLSLRSLLFNILGIDIKKSKE